ncbi:ABC transporter permease [Herbihabitans rhizosphaerae]|nr:ABC transporter permease [Herbihabitans rhizosphaerae]
MSDSLTMLRRQLRHSVRNMSTLFNAVFFPIIMLLMFVYIFGGAFNVGVEYVQYVFPGILTMTIAYGVSMTAITVNNDMTQGIIDRFRTMAISRASVLTGHAGGALIRTLAGVTVITLVALLMGFEPNAEFGEWVLAVLLSAFLILGMAWMVIAFGLKAKTVEGASFAAFPLLFLPFMSSAFAPASTMPAGIRWFTDNQPFTPIIETMRGLLTGTPIGNSGLAAVLWCTGLLLAGYAWARRAYATSGR